MLPHFDASLHPTTQQITEASLIDRLTRIAFDKRVTEAAHWTVLVVGALSLAFSIAATAASAL
jgi:hypothetical protein